VDKDGDPPRRAHRDTVDRHAASTLRAMSSDPWGEVIGIVRLMKAPLRPDASEIRELHGWVAERMPERSDTESIEVLVLGVTVELVTMPWPAQARVTALERSPGMIRGFWAGNLPGRRRVVRGDWDALPFRDGSFDFVLGDGVLNTRTYPAGYLELGAWIRALLRPGGCLFVRAFAQLDPKEEPEQVLAEHRAGGADTYHELRFRFLSSLQPSAADGVLATTEYIDTELEARGFSAEEHRRQVGHELPRGTSGGRPAGYTSGARVSYPTLAELDRVLAPNFRVLGRRHGDHPLAHRCPIYGLQRPG
jgi:SAM-dependent methyltransferase